MDSARLLRATLQSLDDALLVLSSNTGRIVECNPAVSRIFGYTRDELVGRDAGFLFLDDADRLAFRDIMDTVGRSDNAPRHFEFRMRRKDGSRFPTEHTVVQLKAPDGASLGWAHTIQDTTDRTRAAEEARAREERYLLATQAGHVGVWDLDVQTGEFHVDPIVKGFLGYTDAEIPNDLVAWRKLIHADDLEPCVEAAQACIQGRIPGYVCEQRMHHKDGSVRWIRVNGTAIRDETGRVVRIVGADIDVTEQKLAGLRLSDSEQRHRRIVETTNDGICMIDKNATITLANQTMADMLGCTVEQMQGRSLFAFMDEPWRRVCEAKLRRREAGIRERYDLKFRRPDGDDLWVIVSASPLFDDSGRFAGALAAITDITERKQAEQTLQASEERLRTLAAELAAAETQVRRRVAVEVHDRVSQNLVAMKMKLVRLGQAPMPADQRRTTDEVVAMIERAIEDTSSLAFELSPPVLRDVGLGAAVEWLADQFEEQHGLPTEVTACPEAESFDDDGQGMLFQMIRELMINVVKHAQASRLGVTIAASGEELAAAVLDNGRGFDASSIGRPRKKGGGFGLFSIRERLELIGGKLAVEPGPGGGSRVTITVPLAASSKGREEEDGGPNSGRGRPCRSQKGVVRSG